MARKPKSDQPIAELSQMAGPFARQEVILYPDRVELRYQGRLRRWRHRVHLHNTKEKLDCVRNPVTAELVVRFVLLTILGIIVWPVLLRLGYLVYKFSMGRRRMYVLAYGSKLDRAGHTMNLPMFFIPADSPSPEAVEKFLATLANAHKEHMRKIQTSQSETHYISEIKQFHELRQEGVLTLEEFSAIKSELLGMRQKRIGF